MCLKTRGFITFEDHQKDSRIKIVCLTQAGKTLVSLVTGALEYATTGKLIKAPHFDTPGIWQVELEEERKWQKRIKKNKK